MHLDISVHDLDEAEQRATQLGAAKLQDQVAYRSYADPDGHPFCLYRGTSHELPGDRLGWIERIVIDCFSPRALASFYADLLDMPIRELDTPNRVVITRNDQRRPALAFQRAQFPAPAGPTPTTRSRSTSISASTPVMSHASSPSTNMPRNSAQSD